MKTIIVATDFSNAAGNAVQYAASLAKYLNTKLIIFNTFHLPVPTSHVPSYIPNIKDLEDENKERMEKLSLDISAKFSITTEGISSHGFAVDELKKVVQKKEAELVVMGIRGANTLSKKLFGSLTIDLIRDGSFPVLVIPEKAKFYSINKILFACDSSKLTVKTDLNLLKELSFALKAKLQILQVVEERAFAMPDEVVDQPAILPNLESIFLGIKHSYHVVEDDDIVDGIEEAMMDLKSDLLVMAPHKPGFWDKIFNLSSTREMALRTRIPLLALPCAY